MIDARTTGNAFRDPATIVVLVLCAVPLVFMWWMGDRAADRTLTIHQTQRLGMPVGGFEVDVSQLPAHAVVQRTDRGGEGTPVTTLEINSHSRVRVVLVPVEDEP